jgi:hypothetical protein
MSVACVMRPDSSSSLGMYAIVPAGQQHAGIGKHQPVLQSAQTLCQQTTKTESSTAGSRAFFQATPFCMVLSLICVIRSAVHSLWAYVSKLAQQSEGPSVVRCRYCTV